MDVNSLFLTLESRLTSYFKGFFITKSILVLFEEVQIFVKDPNLRLMTN